MAGSTKRQQPTSVFAPGPTRPCTSAFQHGWLCHGERGVEQGPIFSLKFVGSESGAIACAVLLLLYRSCKNVQLDPRSWSLQVSVRKERGRGRSKTWGKKWGREGGRKAAFCARFYPAPTDPVIRRERLSALSAPVGFSPSHLARLSRPPSQLFLCLSFCIVEVQGLQT